MGVKQISLFGEGDTKLEIKKHSSMVQLSNVTTMQERKAMNALIWLAKDALKHDAAANTFTCEIGVIKHLTGLKQNDNEELKTALRSLKSTSIEYNILSKDNKKVRGIFSFLSEVKIIEEGVGKPTSITFEFPSTVLETIKNPNMFVKLDLLIIRGLESKHSIALYEILKDYQNLGKLRIEIEDFRKLMGIEPSQYEIFTMLHKRVIDLPVQEINEKTDMTVSYEFEKLGRKNTAILFTMNNKTTPAPQNNNNSSVIEKLQFYGLKQVQIDDLFHKYDERYLMANIVIVEEQLAKGEIQNVPAYFLKAFHTDFRMAENEYTKKLKQEAEAKAQEQRKQQEQEALEKEQKEQEYVERKRRAEEYLATLTPEEVEKLKQEFLKQNENNFVFQKAFERGGVTHSFVKIQFINFLVKSI